MGKKKLLDASQMAVNKFFSQSEEISPNITYDNNIANIKDTKYDKHTHITNVTNKSKHYNERGKREIRHGLLMDKQLKEDLTQLCNATGNRSINDYIVSLLIEHTEKPESKKLLQEYKNINTLLNN